MGWFTQWGKLGTPNTRLLKLYLFTIEHDSVWLWCFFPFFFLCHKKIEEPCTVNCKKIIHFWVKTIVLLKQEFCAKIIAVIDTMWIFKKLWLQDFFLRIHIFCSFYWPLSRLLDILSPCTEHTYWIENIFPIFRMRELYFHHNFFHAYSIRKCDLIIDQQHMLSYHQISCIC